MNLFEKRTDEELIEEIVAGNADAMDFLMDKYKNLVRSKAKTLFLVGADKEDLIQEGMIGLYKAIRDFKKEMKNEDAGKGKEVEKEGEIKKEDKAE